MTELKFHEHIRNSFFSYGWLLPLLLPAIQVSGRAVENLVWAMYLLWALIAVAGLQRRIGRGALFVLGGLLIAYLCSIPGAEDLRAASHAWIKFSLHSLVFWFTLIALSSRPQALQDMLRTAGYAGLLLLGVLLVMMPWKMAQPQFEPSQVLQEDNLPFLTPFILALLWNTFQSRTRMVVLTVVMLAVFGYILYSTGRSALLGLIVALFISLPSITGIKPLRALLVTILLLGSSIAVTSASFFRDDDGTLPNQAQGAEWVRTIDQFTSSRTVLWRQAILHPPQNPLTGVGLANVRLSPKVTTVTVPGGGSQRIGHLHNFVLDAWYETGVIGLTALLVFLAWPLWRGLQVLRTADERAYCAGLLLASVLAILASGLLSFSYTSLQFSFYLPMLLAALWYLPTSIPGAGQPRT